MGEHKLKPIRKSNEMVVKDLMTFSPYGSLGQVFIIEAIRYYATQVASQPVPEPDKKQFINPADWHGIAVDVLERMNKNYEE